MADIALFIAWGSVDLVRKQKEDKPQMSEMELVPRLKFADRPIVEIFISGTHLPTWLVLPNQQTTHHFPLSLLTDETSYFCIFDASDSVYSVLEPFSKGYHR